MVEIILLTISCEFGKPKYSFCFVRTNIILWKKKNPFAQQILFFEIGKLLNVFRHEPSQKKKVRIQIQM